MVGLMGKLSFGPRVRAHVWKQLSRLLDNRMRLVDALELLKEQAVRRRSPRADVYAHILRTLGAGRTLGQALDGGFASREEILLISFAQDSSRLPGGLSLASKVLQARGKILKSLWGALAYPLVLFFLLIVMMIIVAERVMPQLVLLSNPDTWSGAPYFLYLQSSFVSSWQGVACALIGALLTVLVVLSFSRWTGPVRRLADRFIPWSIYRLTVGTLWLYAVATRMSAGHQISSILRDMATDSGTSPYLREIVQKILDCSGKGEDFGKALKTSGMAFPSAELVDTLAIYSTMPDFQHHIIDLADGWLEDGIETIQSLAGKLKVGVFVLIISELCLVALAIGGLQSQFQGGL